MSEKQYSDPIYDLDGKISVSKAIPFGLQHILAMFVANIAPILIVAGVVKMPVEQSGALVQSAMLVAGIGTLIQLYPIWYGAWAAGCLSLWALVLLSYLSPALSVLSTVTAALWVRYWLVACWKAFWA